MEMFLAALFLIVVLTSGGVYIKKRISAKKNYGLTYNELSKLSEASRKILKEYHTLPEDSKFGNIYDTLVALDTKMGGKKDVDSHFVSHGYECDRYFTWNCCPSWGGKRDPNDLGLAHIKLKDSINAIKTELDERQRALEVAGVQHGLDEYTNLLEHLARERELIKETTKEILS